MAKVDDLLEKRAKQVVLAIVARLAHWSPRQRISPSKESRIPQIGNPKPQENQHTHPAFLQNRLLAQVKSSRSINRFRILHGRLSSFISERAQIHGMLTPIAVSKGRCALNDTLPAPTTPTVLTTVLVMQTSVSAPCATPA